MLKLVLIRHGQSLYNLENKFTGWTDVDLSENGIKEARKAGKILKQHNYTFDIAYTSLLKRAIKTLWEVLDETNLTWLPVYKSWKLNERHYGALQGLNKTKTAEIYGNDQVHTWRRSINERPPALNKTDPRYEISDPKYKNLQAGQFPVTENLADTSERVLQYWNESIIPQLKDRQHVIVSSHGNTIRALVKYLDQLPVDEVTNLNIPTGKPLVYELDDNLQPFKHYYLEEDN
ncbi:MAG TPA: 2,3-diphosphoglycerate-dependent phosphoglycerate mutase [Pseudogracilibacillus sp.]|nr:2,3-diphosphoglycerate-dependent phosphoglycerate mutase [Pseudogracilibacillus sp.]